MDTKIETGLVGVFDILGYQNIIQNNQINYVAELITKVIQQLPKDILDYMKGVTMATKENKLEPVDIIDYKIISDTIIIYMPDHKFPDLNDRLYSFAIFFAYAAFLLNRSFRKGIPLRGSLSYGEYFVSQNTFAGRPLVDCYRLGNSLEISGCVLTKELTEVMRVVNNFDKEYSSRFVEIFYTPYLVPLKNNIAEKIHIINWITSLGELEETIQNDVRQYVYESFKYHNKDIMPVVMNKIENTEMTIRYLRSLNHSLI